MSAVTNRSWNDLLADFRSANHPQSPEIGRALLVDRMLRHLHDELDEGPYDPREAQSFGLLCDAAVEHTARMIDDHERERPQGVFG